MTRYLYLHGFASGPQSSKGVYLRDRFQERNVSLQLLDLNQADFSHLTLTRQIEQVEAELADTDAPVTLVGSSLGGLTSVWVAERNPQVTRLVLLAPAFRFVRRWRDRLGADAIAQWRSRGYFDIYHYAEKRTLPLHINFLDDAERYDETHLQRKVPTLVLHGRSDDVVPISASQAYASRRPWVELVELDSDHALGDVKADIWQATERFCANELG
ncbi:MAG: YqiA/YcfP family alpha/beta fold hydrolase [Cyanobacteria bacterium J06639_1]